MLLFRKVNHGLLNVSCGLNIIWIHLPDHERNNLQLIFGAVFAALIEMWANKGQGIFPWLQQLFMGRENVCIWDCLPFSRPLRNVDFSTCNCAQDNQLQKASSKLGLLSGNANLTILDILLQSPSIGYLKPSIFFLFIKQSDYEVQIFIMRASYQA